MSGPFDEHLNDEQATDLSWLELATITEIRGGEIGPRFTLRLRQPVEVDGRESTLVEFELWQDTEGNGPGYLALVDASR